MDLKKKIVAIALTAVVAIAGFGAFAAPAFAQFDDAYEYEYEDSYATETTELTDEEAAAALGVFFAIYGCVLLFFYIYYGLTVSKMAKKVGEEPAWLAWVPVANTYLMVKIAGLDGWMFLLAFVPGVNLLFIGYLFYKMAERLGFDGWIGLLIYVPPINLAIPAYLAYAEGKAKPMTQNSEA